MEGFWIPPAPPFFGISLQHPNTPMGEMMLDADQLAKDGYDMAVIEALCGSLLATLAEVSSPEEVVLSLSLEALRDDAARIRSEMTHNDKHQAPQRRVRDE